jgi:hypothetical protein
VEREKVNGQRQKSSQTCKDCVHFHITYDPNFPYGCKQMSFKSLRYPYCVVQEATGEACRMRSVKGSGDSAPGESG